MAHVPGFAGYADRRDFGLPLSRTGERTEATTIAVDVRVFPDHLAVEARQSDQWDYLEPLPVQLHRDRVERVELGNGRGLKRWTRFGVVHATFDLVDRDAFDLMVDRRRASDFASVLRAIYGDRFWA